MKRFIMILVFIFAAAVAFAVQPDFTGSFEFEFRAPIDGVLFSHNLPADFADITADLDFTVDEKNLVHTSIKGLSGGNITFGDAYLQTAWGFIITTKLGNISYDSAGYGVSNKDYESQTKGLSGAGFTFEAPLGILTLAGGKYFDVPPDAWGIGLKYSEGIVESLGVSYFLTTHDRDDHTHAFMASGKIISGDISAGAGLKWDDGIFSYGAGVKANLSPTWIAIGAGVSEGDLKIGADSGLAYDTWGIDLIISHVEKIDAVTLDAWKKIGAVTFKAGYDYKAEADDEVFAKITADF